MIAEQIGPNAPAATDDWHVGHGDLHWANLTAPRCMLLDWEHWGLFPRGYDLGRLLGCSAFSPAMMAKIVDAFYDEFRSPAARVGLLAGIASVKGHIALGELDPAGGWALEPSSSACFGWNAKAAARWTCRSAVWLCRPERDSAATRALR